MAEDRRQPRDPRHSPICLRSEGAGNANLVGRSGLPGLELCEGDRYYYSFAFLALTGARRGEALGLRWCDIDWNRRDSKTGKVQTFAAIRQTVIPLTKESGKGREGRVAPRTKTDRAREIELDASTVAMLRTWKARQAKERLLTGTSYDLLPA